MPNDDRSHPRRGTGPRHISAILRDIATHRGPPERDQAPVERPGSPAPSAEAPVPAPSHIAAAAPLKRPAERPRVRPCGVHLELPYELASSHWVARRLPRCTRGTDFLTLCFLCLHARPLWGHDLELLCAMGYATPDDKERFYARVTDLGLSIEMGIRRQTVAESIRRLARCGLLEIHSLPAGFGGWKGMPFVDSRGSYMGTKLYLLSRELDPMFTVTHD